jgi:3-oxoacyl-[acyl-carrier protein] reductase
VLFHEIAFARRLLDLATAMRDQGDGRIVNFYSIDTAAGAWLHSDYNITKAAILALTRSAAVEWGRYGIRVNAIAPIGKGTVWDELIKTPGLEAAAEAMNPLGRVGDPYDDVAPAVVFLASDDSRYVNGQLLNADRGQHVPRYLSKPPNL